MTYFLIVSNLVSFCRAQKVERINVKNWQLSKSDSCEKWIAKCRCRGLGFIYGIGHHSMNTVLSIYCGDLQRYCTAICRGVYRRYGGWLSVAWHMSWVSFLRWVWIWCRLLPSNDMYVTMGRTFYFTKTKNTGVYSVKKWPPQCASNIARRRYYASKKITKVESAIMSTPITPYQISSDRSTMTEDYSWNCLNFRSTVQTFSGHDAL